MIRSVLDRLAWVGKRVSMRQLLGGTACRTACCLVCTRPSGGHGDEVACVDADGFGTTSRPFHANIITTREETTLFRKVLHGAVASALLLALLPALAIAQTTSATQPKDPPPQVAQLRQQFEGLTSQQIEAQGYAPEGPCVPSPTGVGAMGIHALNQQLLQAQFPNGTMDPANPPVLLLDGSGKVMGLEWEAADVGQGPMKMFGQTIELQSGHPGVPEPHYMLHIYFKPGGKVLFGTNDQTAFDPDLSCPPISGSATATGTSTATATATALTDTGGMSLMPALAAGALVLLLAGGLTATALVRRS